MRQIIFDAYHLVRLSAFGATAVLPILGAASADKRLSARRALGLVGVAAAFHAFAYIDNDVCDLELDRTQPLRAHYPLVRGALAPRTALALAIGCIPVAFALDGVVSRQSRHRGRASLAAAFLLLAAYNRWGKRCPVPPLTDLTQALGWAALLRYGAASTGRGPTRCTALLAAYELVLIMLVNGVHGALRDLANDQACGARTTALMLGARVRAAGALQVTPALAAYAAALQTVLLVLPVWGALNNGADLALSERGNVLVSVGVIELITLLVLASALLRGGRPAPAGMLHLILILTAPLALVAPGMKPGTRNVLFTVHIAPLLANGLTYEALGWALDIFSRRR